MYGQGISKTGEVLDMAVEKDLVKKSGAWYSYGNERIGQGRENAKKWFEEHPEAMAELTNKVRVAYGMEPDASLTAAANSEKDTAKDKKPQQESLDMATETKEK